MAKQEKAAKQPRQRTRASFLTKLLLLLLLAGTAWQLLSVQDQVAQAQAEQEQLAAQVEALRQENEALAADIAEGSTADKIEEIAREKLGLVSPGDYVFPDGID